MEPMVNVIAPEAFFKKRVHGDNALKLTADDKLEILELTCRFEWCFDARQLDALEEMLTDDVVIDHVFGFAEGKPAAMAMLRDKVPYRGVRHEASNPVMFINDDGEPAVLSFLTVMQVHDPDDAVMRSLPRVIDHALVTDVMRKGEDGRWRVAKRTFEQMIRAHDRDPDDASWLRFQQTAAQRAKEQQAQAASSS